MIIINVDVPCLCTGTDSKNLPVTIAFAHRIEYKYKNTT